MWEVTISVTSALSPVVTVFFEAEDGAFPPSIVLYQPMVKMFLHYINAFVVPVDVEVYEEISQPDDPLMLQKFMKQPFINVITRHRVLNGEFSHTQ